MLKKKNEIEARQRRERDRIEAIRKEKQLKEDMVNFYRRMEKFFGMEITDGNITIRPLESITQFYQEGKAMHHCVFSMGYYKKNNSLILSAKDKEGRRLETIELNLSTFKVVQSRAVCNNTTPYHNHIIRLVEKNINLIRKKMTA